jgi:hypothetical protein
VKSGTGAGEGSSHRNAVRVGIFMYRVRCIMAGMYESKVQSYLSYLSGGKVSISIRSRISSQRS